MKLLRSLAAGLMLLSASMSAVATPVTDFQTFVNQNIIPNHQNKIDGATTNSALNLLTPIFTAMGWSNSGYSIPSSSLPPIPLSLLPQIPFSQLPSIPANNFVGNPTGSTAALQPVSPTQATAALNPCVGDSGAGGTKGLVPAAPSGSAAAGAFLAADCTFKVPAGGGGSSSVLNYTPVAGDNTTAINNAIATAVANNQTLQFPCSTTIQANGPIFIRSKLVWRGCGIYSTTLQKTPGSGATTFITNVDAGTNNYTSNVTWTDMSVDGYGPSQGGPFYPFVAELISNWRFQRLRFVGTWGTLFYIYEDDTRGSGPSGRPAQPDGQQYNSNIWIEDCIFDGTNEQAAGSDLFDVLRTNGLWISRNQIMNHGSTALGLQFNDNFTVSSNICLGVMRCIYTETVYQGTIRDNTWYSLVTNPYADVPTSAVWITTANETYSGGGYNGSHEVSVVNNHCYNVQRNSGGSGVDCIRVSGTSSSLPTSNILVSGNTCYNLNTVSPGSGPGNCVRLEGYLVNPNASFNQASFTTTTLSTGSYQAPGYALQTYTAAGTPVITGNAP